METLDTQRDVEILVEAHQNNFDNLIIDQEEVKKISSSASIFYMIQKRVETQITCCQLDLLYNLSRRLTV